MEYQPEYQLVSKKVKNKRARKIETEERPKKFSVGSDAPMEQLDSLAIITKSRQSI